MTGENTPTPCVLYAAKSTKDKKGSIQGQLEDGRKLAVEHKLTVVASLNDEDKSAYHGNRGEHLDAAMAECERLVAEQGSCALIVQHSDRLARGDARQARHLVEFTLWSIKTGVRIISKQDPETFPEGDYALLMGAVAGQRNHQDSKRKGAAVADGLKRRAARGQSRGGPRPYGYQRAFRLNDKGEREGYYVKDEAEAAVVRRIFDDYLSGKSARVIAHALTTEKVPAVHGASWPQATIKRLLGRKLYVGIVEDADGNEHRGEHEPIITPEVFAQATAIRKSQARRKGGRKAHGAHLLTKGMLKCGTCGSTLHPRAAKDLYLCGGRIQWGKEYCDQSALSRQAVDSALMRELHRRYIDWEETRRQTEQRHAVGLAMVRQQVAEADAEAAKAEARLAKVTRGWQDEIIPDQEYAEQRAELLSEQAAAQAAAQQARRRLEAAEEGTEPATASDAMLDRIRALEVGPDGLTLASDRDALRLMLAELFAQVVYLAPGHPWLDSQEVRRAGEQVAAGGYLLPMLNEETILGYEGETTAEPDCGHASHEADCAACQRFEASLHAEPYDPADPDPHAIVRKVALPQPVNTEDKRATTV